MKRRTPTIDIDANGRARPPRLRVVPPPRGRDATRADIAGELAPVECACRTWASTGEEFLRRARDPKLHHHACPNAGDLGAPVDKDELRRKLKPIADGLIDTLDAVLGLVKKNAVLVGIGVAVYYFGPPAIGGYIGGRASRPRRSRRRR